MSVVNLPAPDHRAADFCGELFDFILQRADGLSYPAVIGSIEICKDKLNDRQKARVAND